ncbi:PaaI family thioesterase [Tomitella biformata]|uniref:PaaI family thioesterase n=1 Tax=Tomitella biformata TaxID=630403 RepID=UPI0005719BEA|nr:PaaI family thioesterase [Tomitella biformata]
MTSQTLNPASMSGLELLRWMTTQEDPRPGIGKLLGMVPRTIEHGEVSFAITPRADFSNPLGSVHGGICATLLDSVMGCAVHSTLPAGVGYTTLELKLNYIRTVPLDAEEITGHGTVIHVGRTTATAEGKVFDSAGRLVAHGTTTCLIMRPN